MRERESAESEAGAQQQLAAGEELGEFGIAIATHGASTIGITLSERKVLHAVDEFIRIKNRRDEFQIMDTLADRDFELVRVDQCQEALSGSLALRCFAQEIFVLAEKHAPKESGSVEKRGILNLRRAVILSGDHVNTSLPQSLGDCEPNVDVHVAGNAHFSLPRARSRLRIGESAACAIMASTSR